MAWSANLEAIAAVGGMAASRTITLATTPAAGDFLVLLYEGYASTGAPASATVADNKTGNTWTQDVYNNTTGDGKRSVGIWHSTLVAGGSSFAVTLTITDGTHTQADINLAVLRYGTPGGTVSLDSANHAGATTQASPLPCGALTISGVSDLVVACVGCNTSQPSAASGFTREAYSNTAAIDYWSTEDQLGVTAGLTPGFTTTGNNSYIGACAAYEYSSGTSAAALTSFGQQVIGTGVY